MFLSKRTPTARPGMHHRLRIHFQLVSGLAMMGLAGNLAGCLVEVPDVVATTGAPAATTRPAAITADNELLRLTARVAELEQALQQATAQLNRSIARVRQDAAGAASAVTTLTTRLEAITASLQAVSTQVEAVQRTVANHSTALDATAATLTRLEQEVGALEGDLLTVQVDSADARQAALQAAALAATWPSAVSAWVADQYVRRIKYGGLLTIDYDIQAGVTADDFFRRRRYAFTDIGLPVTGPVDGRVLLDVMVEYSPLSTDPTAAFWFCAGGGAVPESYWTALGADPLQGCTTLPSQPIDRHIAPNTRSARFTMMAELISATSFAMQVTANEVMLRDLRRTPLPVWIWVQPVAWLPDPW